MKEAPLESVAISEDGKSQSMNMENVQEEDEDTDCDDEEANGEGQPARTHHENLWFEDGNILIIAGNIEFRIYRGPLIKYSLVFRTILLHPQLATENSIPTITVDDDPEDMEEFLRSFCFGNDMCFAIKNPHFDTICALIRLGHRYDVREAVAYGVRYLKVCYPLDSSGPKGAPRFQVYEHIGVINLARETQTYEVLPMAFLRCCGLEEELLDMALPQRGDGLETLMPADVTRVIMGKRELLRLYEKVFEHWSAFLQKGGCKNESSCVEYLAFIEARLLNEGGDWMADWTESCASFVNDDRWGARRVCDECLWSLKRIEGRERKALWEKWPDILKLKDLVL